MRRRDQPGYSRSAHVMYCTTLVLYDDDLEILWTTQVERGAYK